MLETGMYPPVHKDGLDELLGGLLEVINGEAIRRWSSKAPGCVEIVCGRREIPRDHGSAGIDPPSFADDSAHECPRVVTRFFELAQAHGDHVRGDTEIPDSLPRMHEVELLFISLVREHDQEVPVACGTRLSSGPAAEQPDLLGAHRFDEPRQQRGGDVFSR